jgi:hypothetical protein
MESAALQCHLHFLCVGLLLILNIASLLKVLLAFLLLVRLILRHVGGVASDREVYRRRRKG